MTKAKSKPGILITLLVSGALFAFAIGVLVGYFSRKFPKAENWESLEQPQKLVYVLGEDDDSDIRKTFEENIDTDKLRENLKYLSAEPHLAGSPRDEELAQHIHYTWKKYGFDDVKMHPYQVMLSVPDPSNPNKVELLDGQDMVTWSSRHQEETLRPEDEHPDFIHSFNSYSPSAQVTGELVYVNFGRVEDFDYLQNQGIDVKGKICIVRYGKIYRGNKVKHAEERGAVGVILYLDPEEVAANGTDASSVYPNSWWMPGTAMQRGSIMQGNGDPTTPGYPSIDGVYRLSDKEMVLPKIPSQPIGYDDALLLLKQMKGPKSSKEWTGLLDADYNLGPGFTDSNIKVRIRVNNKLSMKKSYNVFGTIKGEIEPDRYVLIGNHRDSWGYGAVDATTGTSHLLELSRVITDYIKTGWKPRRTMVFCSWGAEEYGLIGSYEWVEEKLPKLQERAVAYINVDICTSGDAIEYQASPLLNDLIWQVTQHVSDPKVPDKTVYDVWQTWDNKEEKPKIKTPGSGSDHAPFAFYAGVPIISMWWRRDKQRYNISIYPAYHTGYETFYLVDKYIDPGFKIHKSCVQMSGLLLHSLTNRPLLPFNASSLADVMKKSLKKFEESNSKKLEGKNVRIDKLEEKILKFANAAKEWHSRITKMDGATQLQVRQINDQMMTLERAFIKPDGLPDSPFKKHMVFAPSKFDAYSGGGFPALTDLMYGVEKLVGQEEQDRWKKIERHVSDLIVVVHFATELLGDNYII